MRGSEVIEVALRVAKAFEHLGIDYLVGGSVASSLHGLPRSTQAIDLVARLTLVHVDELVADLSPSFYVDADMIRDAILRGGCFNVIHLDSMFKVDVFVYTPDDLSREEMERRQTIEMAEHAGQTLSVASPEDVILQKLHWFQLGGRVSERQWLDALGVVKTTGARLDLDYMRLVAKKAGLGEILEELLWSVE